MRSPTPLLMCYPMAWTIITQSYTDGHRQHQSYCVQRAQRRQHQSCKKCVEHAQHLQINSDRLYTLSKEWPKLLACDEHERDAVPGKRILKGVTSRAHMLLPLEDMHALAIMR